VRLRRFNIVTFEENLAIDCVGINGAKNVEIFSFQAMGDLGTIKKLGIGKILFGNFTVEQIAELFNEQDALSAIRFGQLGCNRDLVYNCTVRGNRVVISDYTNTPDYDTVCYRFIGGGIMPDAVIDNVCLHAKIGMDFSYTPNITYFDRDVLFAKNALIRVQDSYHAHNKGESADFTYRGVGTLTTLGCFFPNCWPNVSFPIMEANPRNNLIISEQYGFKTINNLTDASRWSFDLNLVRVTSERARLRREQMIFIGFDLFAVGFEDPFCCAEPVIYGNKHTLGSPILVFDTIEFRFEISDPFPDPAGYQLFLTPPRYLPTDVRFYNLNLDGRYTIGSGRIEIAFLFMEPHTGVFVMDRCHVYNWWHYPEGTVRGLITSHRGSVPVVILPDDVTIFYTERSPSVNGIYVFFHTNDRTQNTRSRYVLKTELNPLGTINSMAIVTNNFFTNLDGNVISVSTPGNCDISNNVLIDCGVRQYDATFAILLEGHTDSTGVYSIKNNYLNTTQPYLFPIGGGKTNKARYAGIEIYGINSAREFLILNNTVAVNGVRPGTIVELPLAAVENTNFDWGWFEDAGPELIKAPVINQRVVHPNRWSASKIADRNTDSSNPNDLIAGTNGDFLGHQDDSSFNDPIQRLLPLSQEDKIQFYTAVQKTKGYPVGLRINMPPQIIIKTLDPLISNFSMFSFFQPQLYPYRIVSIMNDVNAAALLALGESLFQIDNGPGFHGLEDDIVSCLGARDIMDVSFSSCIICNEGCPVRLPDTCVVDPGNATFVPENPYFGTWLFLDIKTAIHQCRSPNRIIMIARQAFPYMDVWDLDIGNYTIVSVNGSLPAQIQSSSSIIFNANNITFSGFDIIHNAADSAPTIVSGTAHPGLLENITISSCTFNGMGTHQPAIVGSFQTLAIISSVFDDYSTTGSEIQVTSDCGMLFFQKNVMNTAKQNALTAQTFDVISILDNEFNDCGSEAPDSAPYCVYIGNCHNTAMLIDFTHNLHHANGYHHVPGTPRRAAYWIDGIALNNRNMSRDFSFNAARGLDIGLRVSNTDDLAPSSIIRDQRATVIYFSVLSTNQNVFGSWHYIVWGDLAADAAIEASPLTTRKFYCDNDCGGSYGGISLIIAFAAIGTIIIGWFIIFIRFRAYNPMENLVAYSEVAGGNVALDTSVMPERIELPPQVNTNRNVITDF
jgi:hypothetical protein